MEIRETAQETFVFSFGLYADRRWIFDTKSWNFNKVLLMVKNFDDHETHIAGEFRYTIFFTKMYNL